MTLTSYAQNFEDVMLWRALKHVSKGRYIDIGAQGPVIDSVSKFFHEQGWQGIHVEPTPVYADQLRQERPGDIVLQAAVSNKVGTVKFYEFPNTGLSTDDQTIAKKHLKGGFPGREIVVPCVTLDEVFSHCTGKDIHWLKIDVEGGEQQVLKSWQRSKVCPWIVLIESTLPLTQIESHQKWESILLAKGYKFAYFDGLNRFYIANQHPDLLKAFYAGPNLFDGFLLSRNSWPWCSNLNSQLQGLEGDLVAERKAGVALLQQREAELQAQLNKLFAEVDERERASVATHVELMSHLTTSQQSAVDATRELANTQQIFAEKISVNQLASLEFTQRSATSEAELNAKLIVILDESTHLAHAFAAREREFAQQLAESAQTFNAELLSSRILMDETQRLLTAKEIELVELRQRMAWHVECSARELERRDEQALVRCSDLKENFGKEVAQLRANLLASVESFGLREQELKEQHLAAHHKALEVTEALAVREREFSQQLAENAHTFNSEMLSSRSLMDETQKVLTAKEIELVELRQRMAWQRKDDIERERLHLQHSEQMNDLELRLQSLQKVSADQIDELRNETEAERVRLMRAHAAEVSELNKAQLAREQETGARMLTLREQAIEAERKLQFETNNRISEQSLVYANELVTLRMHSQDRETNLHEQLASAQRTIVELSSKIQANNDDHACELIKRDLRAKSFEDSSRAQERALFFAQLDSERVSAAGMQDAIQSLRIELDSLKASWSWKLTSPLRWTQTIIVPSTHQMRAATTLAKVMIEEHQIAMNSELSTESKNMSPVNETTFSDQNGICTSQDQQHDIDDQAFVQSAYVMLLGRKPDERGMLYYCNRLRSGISRASILNELRTSPEGLLKGAADGDVCIPILSNKLVAASFTELIVRSDKSFVRCAYMTLLNRKPDDEGYIHYLTRLRNGDAKIHILADIRGSDEAKSRASHVVGLDSAISQWRRSFIPIIGRFFRFYRYDLMETSLRGIENQLMKMSEQHLAKFNHIEAAIFRLSLTPPITNSASVILADNPPLAPEAKSLTSGHASTLRTAVEITDPHVLEVLSELRSAITSAKKVHNENSN